MNAVARPLVGIPQLCPGNIIPFQPRASDRAESSGGAASVASPGAGSDYAIARADKIFDYINRAKAAAWYLRLVNHAQGCGGCKSASCTKTKALLLHCSACDGSQVCTKAGCMQTKRLQRHASECRGPGCVLCSLLADGQNIQPPSANAPVLPAPSAVAVKQPCNTTASSKRRVECSPNRDSKIGSVKRSRKAA